MLDVAILGLLVEGDLHGYELKKRLAELLGPWSSVSFGSLYPALARLERKGLVATVRSAPTSSTPMSGSLGAELAAFRREPGAGRTAGSRRARKVYALTDDGRAELLARLADASGDERSFAVRVAFCRLLDPRSRLALFRSRRAELDQRARGRVTADPRNDLYRRSLFEFQADRLHRELRWVDELIASAEVDAGSDEPGPDTSSRPDDTLIPGGSPS